MKLCFVLIGFLLFTGAAQAGSVWLPTSSLGGVTVPNVQSLAERKFSRTVKQKFDFSCGSAAVATLLSYQYGDPVDERQVFQFMWEHGNQSKIRQEGFSLLDVKRYLNARGYKGNGYKAPLDKLIDNSVPAIVLIGDHGYNHFVVVKGIHNRRVLVGDPSRGARSISRKKFQDLLISPIVFVVTSDRQRAVFNGQIDWTTQPAAPLGVAVTESSLALATVLTPGPGTF